MRGFLRWAPLVLIGLACLWLLAPWPRIADGKGEEPVRRQQTGAPDQVNSSESEPSSGTGAASSSGDQANGEGGRSLIYGTEEPHEPWFSDPAKIGEVNAQFVALLPLNRADFSDRRARDQEHLARLLAFLQTSDRRVGPLDGFSAEDFVGMKHDIAADALKTLRRLEQHMAEAERGDAHPSAQQVLARPFEYPLSVVFKAVAPSVPVGEISYLRSVECSDLREAAFQDWLVARGEHRIVSYAWNGAKIVSGVAAEQQEEPADLWPQELVLRTQAVDAIRSEYLNALRRFLEG